MLVDLRPSNPQGMRNVQVSDERKELFFSWEALSIIFHSSNASFSRMKKIGKEEIYQEDKLKISLRRHSGTSEDQPNRDRWMC